MGIKLTDIDIIKFTFSGYERFLYGTPMAEVCRKYYKILDEMQNSDKFKNNIVRGSISDIPEDSLKKIGIDDILDSFSREFDEALKKNNNKSDKDYVEGNEIEDDSLAMMIIEDTKDLINDFKNRRSLTKSPFIANQATFFGTGANISYYPLRKNVDPDKIPVSFDPGSEDDIDNSQNVMIKNLLSQSDSGITELEKIAKKYNLPSVYKSCYAAKKGFYNLIDEAEKGNLSAEREAELKKDYLEKLGGLKTELKKCLETKYEESDLNLFDKKKSQFDQIINRSENRGLRLAEDKCTVHENYLKSGLPAGGITQHSEALQNLETIGETVDNLVKQTSNSQKLKDSYEKLKTALNRIQNEKFLTEKERKNYCKNVKDQFSVFNKEYQKFTKNFKLLEKYEKYRSNIENELRGRTRFNDSFNSSFNSFEKSIKGAVNSLDIAPVEKTPKTAAKDNSINSINNESARVTKISFDVLGNNIGKAAKKDIAGRIKKGEGLKKPLEIGEKADRVFQAWDEDAAEASGFFHDSDEYIAFHHQLKKVRELAWRINKKQLKNEKYLNVGDFSGNASYALSEYADAKGNVSIADATTVYENEWKKLQDCALEYEKYKMKDHTFNPKGEKGKKKLNSDDKTKLKVVGRVLGRNIVEEARKKAAAENEISL